MLRRLYDWCIAAADKPYATWLMGIISFTESSFFPIPPDTMLIPMSLARPDKAWFYATVCTLTSVAGGVLGYFIGAVLYNSIGLWLIQLYGYGDKVEAFRKSYAEWGGWIILLKGVTPIPYKIVTIASGFAGYNLFMFVRAFVCRARDALLSGGVPAQPLRPAGAGDHRGAAGVLGGARYHRAGGRHCRRRLSVLIGPAVPHFCHSPRAVFSRSGGKGNGDARPAIEQSALENRRRCLRGNRRLRSAFSSRRRWRRIHSNRDRAATRPAAIRPRPPRRRPGSRPGFIERAWALAGGGRKPAEDRHRRRAGSPRSARRRGSRCRQGRRRPVRHCRTAFSARERCPAAPNGAPDCQSAAEALCRGKGFKAGKILDTQTEQKCPARLLLSGRAPNASGCSTEIFVTRAICH